MSRQRVTRSLQRLGQSGAFAVQHREPALGLGIEVDGVGRCSFPLTPDRVASMIERAVPSPFGYRDQTRHDPSVRSSWEIPGTWVHVDAAWARRFDRGLDAVRDGLGLPIGAVTAVLQKLIIYAPGQFFARHRDSQTQPGTTATLVVVLPSPHRGGELRVSHAGREITLCAATDASANYLAFAGFYADCPHETVPVESGHRVVLSYALEVEPRALLTELGTTGDLEASLRAYFFGDDEPDWLVYLLEHQYSAQSLDWDRLKLEDRTRVWALIDAAGRLDCDCFLALAEAHQTREYVGDDEDDEDDQSDEGYEPDGSAQRCLPSPLPDRNDDPPDRGPLRIIGGTTSSEPGGQSLDLSVTLTAWIDRARRPCRGTDRSADGSEVLHTFDFDERTPYQAEAEPWTGNEGGTSETWYSEAALVIIPRDRDLHAEIAEIIEVDDDAAP